MIFNDCKFYSQFLLYIVVLTLSLYASLTRKQKASEIRVIFLIRELYEQILTSTDSVPMMAKIVNKKHRDCLKMMIFTVDAFLQSKQVKRSSHEWINKFIIANLISVIISIICSSDE